MKAKDIIVNKFFKTHYYHRFFTDIEYTNVPIPLASSNAFSLSLARASVELDPHLQ